MEANLPQVLVSPIRLGALQLSHRLVVAQDVRTAARPEGSAPARDLEKLASHVAPGGLVICAARPEVPHALQDAVPGLHTAAQVNHWIEVTQTMKSHGAIVVAQLGNGAHEGATLDADEIDAVLDAYRTAAESAGDAGFAGVELRASQGTLGERLLWADVRVPESLRIDMVEALLATWNPDRVGVALAVPQAQLVKQGYARALTPLAQLPLAYLRFIMGRSCALHDADATLDAVRSLFRVAIVLSGELSPAEAARLVSSGMADAVGIGCAPGSAEVAQQGGGRPDIG